MFPTLIQKQKKTLLHPHITCEHVSVYKFEYVTRYKHERQNEAVHCFTREVSMSSSNSKYLHTDLASARLCLDPVAVSSCLSVPLSPSVLPPNRVNIVCFAVNCPRNLLKKWDVRPVRVPPTTGTDSNQIIVVYVGKARARGGTRDERRASPLFGTRTFIIVSFFMMTNNR